MAALAAGALAVVRKPAGPADPASATDREHLIRTLRLMAGVKVVTRHPPRAKPTPVLHRTSNQIDIVAIAASTGGPAALQTVLTDLGAHMPVPVVIAQHMAVGFAQALADWLASVVPQPIHVVTRELSLTPGHVYIPADNLHLVIKQPGTVGVIPISDTDRYCPSADRLFASVVCHYGARAIGVILTGMGEDGAQGLAELAAAGAITFGQDEASCVVYGMPKAAKALGAVRYELPLERLGLSVAALLTPVQPKD